MHTQYALPVPSLQVFAASNTIRYIQTPTRRDAPLVAAAWAMQPMQAEFHTNRSVPIANRVASCSRTAAQDAPSPAGVEEGVKTLLRGPYRGLRLCFQLSSCCRRSG